MAASAVEATVRAAGWSLIDKPFTPKEVDAVMGCFLSAEAWPCVSRAVPKPILERGVGRIAAVTLDPQALPDGGRQVVISERLVLANAESAVVGQRFCEHCTDDTLAALTGELTKELLDRAALRSGRTVLSVKSTPQRARYAVDGTLTGVTDAAIEVVPGKHIVTIEYDGFEHVTRTAFAEEGKTAEVSATLQRLDPGRDRAVSDLEHGGPNDRAATVQRLGAGPAILLVVGGGVAVAGAVLLAFDQGPTTKRRGEDQPRGYYDTVPAGIGFIVGGAAVAGLGGYLWWRSLHSQTSTSSTPMVTPVAGGAVIGVLEAF